MPIAHDAIWRRVKWSTNPVADCAARIVAWQAEFAAARTPPERRAAQAQIDYWLRQQRLWIAYLKQEEGHDDRHPYEPGP